MSEVINYPYADKSGECIICGKLVFELSSGCTCAMSFARGQIKQLIREVNLGIDLLHDATMSRDLKIDKLRAEVESIKRECDQ